MPFGMARRPCLARCQLTQIFTLPSVFRRGLSSNFIGLLRFCRRRFWPPLFPQPLGDRERVDIDALPPGHLIASLMQLPMMTAAERHGELIADFETQRSGLRKP
jgi:hypothetical protein